MSPLLKSVEKAGLRGVRSKRDPSQIRPDDFFTLPRTLRAAFAKLVNVSNIDRISIIPSVSYGLSAVTKNVIVGKGEHILIAAEQFPSNYYPWQSLCEETGASIRIVSPENGTASRGKIWNERILESINRQTKVVALAHSHWADGTVFDLLAIRQRTRETGTLLIVDGTQSVGALPFDVQLIQPDALVCAAYKWLLGPYSMGLAYYGEHFDDGKPIEENWINRLNSENFSGLISYESGYKPAASRFSVGEQSNFILAPMALKAIEQITRWGIDNIQEYCRSITEAPIQMLREKGFLIDELPWRASHLFGVRHPHRMETEKIKERLQQNKVFVSVRGDAIRVSPHVYNNEGDLNKLVKILMADV